MACCTLFGGYTGSKASSVSPITGFFDRNCTKYIEPFVGGGSIFFSMPNGRYEKECINDYDPAVAFIYKALSDTEYRQASINAILSVEKNDNKEIANASFVESLKNVERVVHSRTKKLSEFGYTKEYVVSMVADIYRIYSQSFNCGGCSYSKQKESYKYKQETKRRLDCSMERLSKENLHVWNINALDIIRKFKDKAEIQFYIDWPYVGLYRRCDDLYRTELVSLYEHIQYAEELKDAKSAVVFSDYRCSQDGVPTIYDAILGDEWHCYKIGDPYNYCEVVEKGQERKKAAEFIWTNRVPETAGLYCLLEDYKEKLTLDEYWERIRTAGLKMKLEAKHMEEYNRAYSALNENKELFSKNEIKAVRAKEKERA